MLEENVSSQFDWLPKAVQPRVMDFQLRKPPVIEAWIRATMIPAPESEWDWDDAFKMLGTYEQSLPVFEHLPAFTPEARGVKKGELPKAFEIRVEPRYFRIRTDDRSRIIQVGRNELLVVHGRENERGFSGFEALLQSFLDSVERYNAHLPTSGVDSVELHYVDLVVIPNLYGEKRSRSPGEFFVGAPDLPDEPFGGIASLSWSYILACPNNLDMTQLAIQMLTPDGNAGRFRLDWHTRCPALATSDMGSVEARLQVAHAYLKSCFKAVCTEAVWNLFEPID